LCYQQVKFKHIHFIINPASAKEEPILAYISRAFGDSSTDWDISVTKKNLDAGAIARKLLGTTDLVVVYGGDGCITSVAAALYGTKLPMAILPGGTANVMAGELGVPTNTEAALEILQKGRFRVKAIDMGLVNGKPFLLRVNLGIMANMIIGANRKLKNNFGQMAYGLTAIQTMADADPVMYEIQLDQKKKFKVSGVALTITNSGHMGMGDLKLQPGISVTDGLLDVILMPDKDFLTLLKVTGSTLLQNETTALGHWTCRTAVINLPEKQTQQ
jgi:diacylglycerol kinase (ATP)